MTNIAEVVRLPPGRLNPTGVTRPLKLKINSLQFYFCMIYAFKALPEAVLVDFVSMVAGNLEPTFRPSANSVDQNKSESRCRYWTGILDVGL